MSSDYVRTCFKANSGVSAGILKNGIGCANFCTTVIRMFILQTRRIEYVHCSALILGSELYRACHPSVHLGETDEHEEFLQV